MFATIVNINDNNWVSIVVDFKALNILYGDSMGGAIDEDVEEIFTVHGGPATIQVPHSRKPIFQLVFKSPVWSGF